MNVVMLIVVALITTRQNYESKKFYRKAPGPNVIKLFTSVIYEFS
jgi:hypothetical protein